MAMEGGGMIDFIMDIIRDTVESARAETSERACRARQQQHQQQQMLKNYKLVHQMFHTTKEQNIIVQLH